MKFRALLMAAAGIAGTVSVAGAQPAPDAQPVPDGQPEPEAQPEAQPTPEIRPVPEVQPAPLQWGMSPGPDALTPGAAEPTPLPWRGTTFTFNQAGTTTMFGVGRDNIGSEGEFYGWDFTLRPIYYLLDLPKDKLAATAEIGFATELTNSDTTADRNETQFKDIQLGLLYTRDLWESGGAERGEYATTGELALRGLLPTSPSSYDTGKYLTLAVGPTLQQKVKLLGSKADGLNSALVRLGLTYSHLFSAASTPTNPDLHVPRQNATGQTIDSDQLRGNSFDIDRLTTRVSVWVPLYKDLLLRTAFGLISRWRHDFEDGAGAGAGCDVVIANDPCVEATRLEDRALYHPSTSFDLALSYPIYEVVGLTLGYSNETAQIGEDGQRRNFFYSPEAQFYLDITANLDVIFMKTTRRDARRASAASKRPANNGF